MEASDTAVMREAVKEIKDTANSALTALSIGNDPSAFLWCIIRKCDAALAKPARNCDVGTVEETAPNPPTEKQVRFAEAISQSLGIPLPEKKTRQSLFLFIRDNRGAFDRLPTFEDCEHDDEWVYPSLEDTF